LCQRHRYHLARHPENFNQSDDLLDTRGILLKSVHTNGSASKIFPLRPANRRRLHGIPDRAAFICGSE
jgi:hypothetical protein